MGTYYNRNHMIPEASNGSSVSHFAWFYPGSLFSTPKSSLGLSQGSQNNPQQGLAAAPIRCVGPTDEPANNNNSGTKATKSRKQRPAVKVSNPIPSKALQPKQSKKTSSKKSKGSSMPEAKREKKDLNININSLNFDLSGVPSPFCSCTGIPRVCYKWGAGGWQSSCCTINISEYPLPMSSTRPGARMAGRKMSTGAYVKLLLKLAAGGQDLCHPVDLKDHWARHGTNKFVTIK